MIDYTEDDYHRTRHGELLENEDLRTAWSHFADRAYFSDVKRGQTVLEYGGGLGSNLLSVATRADTWMVEPAEIGRRLAQKAGIRTAVSSDELLGEYFDVILCRHVLEHVDHPLNTLRELHRLLKPNGTLVLVLPCDPIDAQPDADDIDHHLYCWNPRTISNLAVKAGFHLLGNHYEHFGARRKLMPVYRLLGGVAYAKAVRLVGRIFRFRELVLKLSPSGRT